MISQVRNWDDMEMTCVVTLIDLGCEPVEVHGFNPIVGR